MPLFPKRDPHKHAPGDGHKDAKLEEELSELTALKRPKEVDRARGEAEAAVSHATMAEIRGIAMIERGRCPECGGRTEIFLFTTLCATCGWYRRREGEVGRCSVLLDTGETIECDRTYDAKNDFVLCVKDRAVFAQVGRSHIRRIDFVWQEEELTQAWQRFRREHTGICAWCEKELGQEGDLPAVEEYVAFGAYQERHLICCAKCLGAFRKQYPTRIHRNCYETDCNICEQCHKRFDTTGWQRAVLP